MMRDDIRRFLFPQTVAVIGASEDSSKFGGRVLEYLLKFGFPGTIVPINVRATALRGVPAYPSIQASPVPVDVAIMAVPAETALESIRECGRAGVKACVLITAQFAEIGGEGARRQAAVVAAAREHGMRLLGPNCLGYVNPLGRTAMSSTLSLSAITELPRGAIGLVSQSGALMGSMIAVGEEMGAGFSTCVSVGNQCDLELSDFVEYLAEDPATRVICLYVEGLVSPARLIAAVDRARANGKPVLMAKSGRTESGARAVKSHTASLAGSYASLQAICEAHGVVLMDDAIDMLSVARCMDRLGRMQGDGIALLSGSGGGAALLVDALAERNLRIATLGASTKERLADFLPATHRHLPLDFGAMRQKVGTQDYRDAGRRLIRLVMADPDVAAGIVLLTTQPDMDDVARTVEEVGTECGKPLLFINAGGKAGEGARAVMREASYPSFSHPLDAVRVVASLAQDFRLRSPAAPVEPEKLALDGTLAELPRGLLNESQAKRLLAAAGVPVTRERLARDADEAARVAAEIGFPVVLKAQARELSHKSDAGGVALNLSSAAEVRDAYRAIADRVRAHAQLELEGCLVQEMVKADAEVIVGSRWDEQFGAMLLVGTGGTLVELLKDVRLVPAPIGAQAAVQILRSLKLAPLLTGYRGKPPVDLDALGGVIARISHLAANLGSRLAELDANPLLVARGRAVVADARAVLAEAD
jgi:acetyl-CoA synthetase (ADP-forming)